MSYQDNYNPPAFPLARGAYVQAKGMTLRDYFAASLVLSEEEKRPDYLSDIALSLGEPIPSQGFDEAATMRLSNIHEARVRYAKADAMLAERQQPQAAAGKEEAK